MEAGKQHSYTLYDALQVIDQAWSMVNPRTITRCFRRASFKHPNITEPTPEEEMFADSSDDDAEVLNRYVSFEDGPEIAELQNLSIKMQAYDI